jgi:hypothetical protein
MQPILVLGWPFLRLRKVTISATLRIAFIQLHAGLADIQEHVKRETDIVT